MLGRGDIPAALERGYNDWYDREHMAERLGLPGVLWGRRYRSRRTRPVYAAAYQLADRAVLSSPEWRSVSLKNETSPSPEFLRYRPRFENFRRDLLEATEPCAPIAPPGGAEMLVVIGEVRGRRWCEAVADELRRAGLGDGDVRTFSVRESGHECVVALPPAGSDPTRSDTLVGELTLHLALLGDTAVSVDVYDQIFPTPTRNDTTKVRPHAIP